MTEARNESREQLLDSMRELMERAEEKGYLTIDDVLELLPEAEENLPAIEQAMAYLDRRGVRIVTLDDTLLPSLSAESGQAECHGTAEPLDSGQIDSYDSVALYFREMGSVPLLSREEELDLAKQIERGRIAQEQLEKGGLSSELFTQCLRDVEAGKKARDHMIKANTRLVVSVAKRYIRLGLPFLDLIQEGNLGLMKALDKFDYRRGCKVSTYATWWIRQSITRALSEQGRVIRLPSYISYHIRKMRRISENLEQSTGKMPMPKEIAARMGVSPARVRWLLKVSRRPLSLQMPVGGEKDAELAHFIQDVDSLAPPEVTEEKLLSDRVDVALATLTPRQARILRMRFGLDNERVHTLKEVAAKFGLTRERIRQIERKALRRLRHPSRSRYLRPYLS